MFSKVVKLILTGVKNDKILTTVVVWTCYAWIFTISQINTLSMISASNVLEQFCKLQQKHAIMNELWVKLWNRKLVQRGTQLPNTIDYTLHIKITPIHNIICIGWEAVRLWNSYP